MDGNALAAIVAAALAGAALNACTSRLNAEPSLVAGATATLKDATGATKGSASVRPMGDGLHVDATVEGMAPGTYAIHIHQTAQCTPPSFESAGAHWNPTGREHGSLNPRGSHKGDLPNITVGADGHGTLSAHISDAMLKGDTEGLLDADRAAIVVHADADDYRTDPSGDAGGRIACGELQPA